jgi:steroid 5-alpha reductase family enzyme
VIVFAVTALWVVSTIRRDASIVDPFWGIGFVMVAWIAWFNNSPAGPRVAIVTALTTIWGLRLSLFLLWRNIGHGEDRRYAEMRARHGAKFWWVSLFTVYLLQGAILLFVSLPVQCVAALNLPVSLGWMDAAGVAIWSLGMFFETVGDWQLARFKVEPNSTGRVMDRGLWRYTRHPNYFGDFCVWWGIYLTAAAGGAWLTVFSPLLMTTLLMKVSGVRLLEATISDRRPDYVAYAARTNTFFPGPRKNS